MAKIAVFVGSLRKDSLNKKLAQNLESFAPDGVKFEYVNLEQPLFNGDVEADLPKSVRAMKAMVEGADAVLFVTPEYNRSIPGVLKNAIDWSTRPNNSFIGKPVAIAGATNGALGTAVAQSNLRHIVSHLGMYLMGQPELYFNFASQKLDERGVVTDENREKLNSYIDHFVEHINKLT